MPRTVPTSTYRLQITGSFTLGDAAALTDHLRDLGVGAVYCSPLLQAASGSDHGYDTVDPTRIDVDRGNPAALGEWQHQVGRLSGTSDAPDWEAPSYGAWRIASRVLANPGSAGAPLYRLGLVPVDSALGAWQAGDLAQACEHWVDHTHPGTDVVVLVGGQEHYPLLVSVE